MQQHFMRKHPLKQAKDTCGKCHKCQVMKKHTKKCRLPPAENAEQESEPWEKLCADLMGPHQTSKKVKGQKKKVFVLHVATVMDPATGWFEVAPITDEGLTALSVEIMTNFSQPTPSAASATERVP